MGERRTSGHRAAMRSGGPATAIQHLWGRVVQRPVDFVAVLGAAAVSVVIVVNGVFLQAYVHPAPFFAAPGPSSSPGGNPAAAYSATPKRLDAAAARPVSPQRPIQGVSAHRSDPIADLIGTAAGASSARVAAVQRLLSAYGYGQIRASGVVDEPTSSAIAKFETEHKMPITGRLSDRLLTELAVMTGHPVE